MRNLPFFWYTYGVAGVAIPPLHLDEVVVAGPGDAEGLASAAGDVVDAEGDVNYAGCVVGVVIVIVGDLVGGDYSIIVVFVVCMIRRHGQEERGEERSRFHFSEKRGRTQGEKRR